MTTLFNDFRPTISILIAVAVLFFNHGKQLKKWEANRPSRPTHWRARIVLGGIVLVIFSFGWSALLAPSMPYVLINTLIVVVIAGSYTYKVLNDMKK